MGYKNIFDFYEIKDVIGKGQFGYVNIATHKKTNQKVAVKII